MIYVFVFSFLVALTGALSPGPLLTFTIYKSLKSKYGYLEGLLIIFGHALIEFLLIVALLLGANFFLGNIVIITIVGVVGGTLLIIYGLLVIKNTVIKGVSIEIMDIENNRPKIKDNSIFGGMIVSLSNPYFLFWWAVIGLSFMLNFEINFNDPIGLLLFFLGHELGDLVWYFPISLFVHFGGKSLNERIYKAILLLCGLFMIGFGIYLAVNIFVNPPPSI